MREQIGDVGDPGPIRVVNRELPIQRVVDHDRRPNALLAGLLLVYDLDLNTRQPGLSRHPVLTNRLAHHNQIVMDLAIPIDVAAVLKQIVYKSWGTSSGLCRLIPISDLRVLTLLVDQFNGGGSVTVMPCSWSIPVRTLRSDFRPSERR
jgi:hypothetical protein